MQNKTKREGDPWHSPYQGSVEERHKYAQAQGDQINSFTDANISSITDLKKSGK